VNLVFVYGTLKRGLSNHAYLAGQAFVGEASTAGGYALFDAGGYPGMVAAPGGNPGGITGEVWSVDPGCLEQLDLLEGTAEGLYRRQAVPLAPPFADKAVEAYIFLGDILGRQPLGPTWTEG
jgi:gamma-glutamylaminecyclotransferase